VFISHNYVIISNHQVLYGNKSIPFETGFLNCFGNISTHSSEKKDHVRKRENEKPQAKLGEFY
jgi:hypothetical protein